MEQAERGWHRLEAPLRRGGLADEVQQSASHGGRRQGEGLLSAGEAGGVRTGEPAPGDRRRIALGAGDLACGQQGGAAAERFNQ